MRAGKLEFKKVRKRVLRTAESINVHLKIHWCVTLTCSAALLSAVLGRLEESGLSDVSDCDEGLLEGTESDWCRSSWLDAADTEG